LYTTYASALLPTTALLTVTKPLQATFTQIARFDPPLASSPPSRAPREHRSPPRPFARAHDLFSIPSPASRAGRRPPLWSNHISEPLASQPPPIEPLVSGMVESTTTSDSSSSTHRRAPVEEGELPYSGSWAERPNGPGNPSWASLRATMG
jgi:hypothetical protein